MDTHYIREFVVLSDCLSFSEAASELYLSQSSLSKHIKAMEKELGVTLFFRTTRKIELTEAGGAFLGYARQISNLMAAGESAISILKQRHQNTLTIGVQTPQYYDLLNFISGFNELHPNIEFKLVESDEATLFEMFQRHQFNLFTTLNPPADKRSIHYIPLMRSEITAILKKDHPLADREFLTLEDIADSRLMLPSRRSTLSEIILAAFGKSGIVPFISYEGASEFSIKLLKHDTGIALHSREFGNAVAEDLDIRLLPLKPSISFTYGLGYRSAPELSETELYYIDYIKTLKSDLTKG